MPNEDHRILSSFEAASAVILCALIPLLTFLQGGATPSAELLAALAVLVTFAATFLSRPDQAPPLSLAGPVGGLTLLAALALAQSIRLPAFLAGLVSAERVEIARRAAAVIGAPDPSWLTLSLTPSLSVGAARDLLVVAAAVVAGYYAFRVRRRRRWLVGVLLLAGCAQVIAGLGPWLAGRVPRLSGTYANSDHLATFLEMAVAMCFVTVVWAGTSRRWTHDPERRTLVILGFGLIFIALLLGLVFTGSRAALLAVVFGLLLEVALLVRQAGQRRSVLVALAVAILAGGTIVWVGVQGAFGRLVGTSWYETISIGRPAVWRDSVPLIADFPWLGTGLGSFREAFALVQSPVSSATTWAKAHNQYLELLICGGLFGLLVLALALAATVRQLLGRVVVSGRTENKLFVVGTLGALTATAIHEFFDFGLSLSANSVLLAALVGGALSVGSRSKKRRSEARE